MPDQQGNLTTEEKEKAVRWIEGHWKGPKQCPISGHNSWDLAGHLVTPLVTAPGVALLLGGPSYPQVLLICKGCGYTMTFNAVLMGLVAPTVKPQQEPENG